MDVQYCSIDFNPSLQRGIRLESTNCPFRFAKIRKVQWKIFHPRFPYVSTMTVHRWVSLGYKKNCQKTWSRLAFSPDGFEKFLKKTHEFQALTLWLQSTPRSVVHQGMIHSSRRSNNSLLYRSFSRFG